ncbi:MAG: hypothetical protein J6386_07840 [Candidatus Synoicihabitans palmerolidicus]|nr:hypothetical protein [Candidatus Synoicihabitans palmerolidicus]
MQENGADYLMSVTGNRPALRKAIGKRMDASEVRKIFTLERGHGRTERRSIAAIDASPTDLTLRGAGRPDHPRAREPHDR